MKHLGFRCYGPLASWGDIAVGEHRPTYTMPSRSAILGMVACALGVRRDEEDRLRSLWASIGVAVRVDVSGTPGKDYHTAQVAPRTLRPRGGRWFSRREELRADELHTILSTRDYVAGEMSTVVLWRRSEGDPTLGAVRDALRHPAYSLYLGRKCNPLGLPAAPMIVEAATLREAFDGYVIPSDGLVDGIKRPERPYVYWDSDYARHGFDEVQQRTRRDDPLSSGRRQFAERLESVGLAPARASDLSQKS